MIGPIDGVLEHGGIRVSVHRPTMYRLVAVVDVGSPLFPRHKLSLLLGKLSFMGCTPQHAHSLSSATRQWLDSGIAKMAEGDAEAIRALLLARRSGRNVSLAAWIPSNLRSQRPVKPRVGLRDTAGGCLDRASMRSKSFVVWLCNALRAHHSQTGTGAQGPRVGP